MLCCCRAFGLAMALHACGQASDEAVLLDCGGANSTRLAGGAEASAAILPAAVNASEPTFALEMGDQIRNAQMRLIGGSESAGVLAMNVDGRGWAPVCGCAGASTARWG